MRYYLTRLIGTGTLEDPFRPELGGLTAKQFEIALPPQDDKGMYAKDSCVLRVLAADYTSADENPDMVLLIDETEKDAAVPVEKRTKLSQDLLAKGVPVDVSKTGEAVVQTVLAHLDPNARIKGIRTPVSKEVEVLLGIRQ